MATMTPAAAAPNPAQTNYANRMMTLPGVNGSATRRRVQNIFSQVVPNYIAGQGLTLNVAPAPVGILTRFLVRVTASIGQGAAETQTKTSIGPAAIFSNISYVDTSNIQRIATTGRHMAMLASHRHRRPFGAAETSDLSSAIGIGANYTAGIISAPPTLTAAPPVASAPNFAMTYEIPVAYGPKDLRGGVLSNFVNATQTLSLTLNPNFFAASGDNSNAANAGYISSTAQLGAIRSLTVNVYQEYLDGYNPATLPEVDLSTLYYITESGGFLPTPNTDLVIPFQNFRSFLSAMIIFNNGGQLNAGSDINYMSLRLASATDLIKIDPFITALENREIMRADVPAGYHMFDFRENPIFTTAFGNTSLVLNPSVVNANAVVNVGWEALGPGNNVPAQGLPSGG